ncbi:glycoside hydrolase family 97 protein [Thalassotalea litorea]|uniref:Glycoside hydrolase family 97 protein n=1 Tax=Thalassotalea litorea TaxID=2020715 RepID=A0A5R9IIA0_9GAMM|nr:glycoside hydrolase family 97 protein [Thalassotalea litorea]TLU65235.1 glycoside hydrolase family 97 protein [Thalassotalea litorea]
MNKLTRLNKTFCYLLTILSALSAAVVAKEVKVTSPDGRITFTVSDDDKTPKYRIDFNDQEVIEPSALGLVFRDSDYFEAGFEIQSTTRNQVNATWEQPWGESKNIVDHHNELNVTFSADRDKVNTYGLRIRVFNDGVGFRYEVPEQKGLNQVNITNELTEFVMEKNADATAWWIPTRGWNRYEYVYNTTTLREVDRAHTPFTMKLTNGVHVSIHEAALVDYAAMSLDQRRHGFLKADLAPWSDGVLVKKQGAFNTPWRTVQISDDATGLLNSHLILNLNEPNKLGDVAWVEPGKYVGIWWGMHINENTWGSGDKHGATTDEVKRYMDFAAQYGFDGVLVEGWNIGWDGNWFFNGDVFSFTESYPDFDMDAIYKYAKDKGVRLIGHHETSGNVTNYRNQMEAAFALYQKHNVAQVKTGYVADGGNIKRIDENGVARKEWHDGQFMVNEYLYNIKMAAKYKISINTHEPVKDTGLRRTYPNWISREGARGQEFNAWGNPPNPPEHAAILPYTRMLSGPMDFTPGIFDMSFNGLGADTNRPQTTLAKQLALYVVLYSPIQMAADLPRNYQANLPAFQFIQDVPTDWEKSIALDGEVGDFVIFARQQRDSNDWFIGGLTDEDARDVSVALTFLQPGVKYRAQIYRDSEDTNWVDNPAEITIEEKLVTAKDTLKLTMANSGGFAIRLQAQ